MRLTVGRKSRNETEQKPFRDPRKGVVNDPVLEAQVRLVRNFHNWGAGLLALISPAVATGRGYLSERSEIDTSPAMLIAEIGSQPMTIITQTGVGLRPVIAAVCFWHRNRSNLWAILAAIFSWLYVNYFAMTRQRDEVK